MFEVIV